MVNWVTAQMWWVRGLAKLAGLRQQTVEVELGTVMSFWVPKEKVGSRNNPEVVPLGNPEDDTTITIQEKPAVVLLHGFAADGVMTWAFQVGALTNHYSVYIPDLLFFGGSSTDRGERSLAFQAECLAAALERLGVRRCSVVGFSYGGVVAFKMAEVRPDLVDAIAVSGTVFPMTETSAQSAVERAGASVAAEILLPDSVKGVRALFSAVTYQISWLTDRLPDRLLTDFVEAMVYNRKERAEILKASPVSDDAKMPTLSQRILFLWGENDKIFNLDLAQNMKEQLGEKATIRTIPKSGHIAHIERPFVYNHHLKEFLALVHAESFPKQ